MVVPRSVAEVRASPGWDPLRVSGIRRLCEVATDEMALAGMTLTGPMGGLQRPAHDYDRVAAELVSLGIDRAHVDPAALCPMAITSHRLGRVRYERMIYRHRPDLPPVLEAEGCGGPADGVVHLIRHPDGPRPWLIWVHGTGMGGPADIVASRAYRFFSRLGLNVALPIQPGQGVRRRAWPAYPAIDPINNVAGMMRTISEVRAVVRWVQPQATSITVAGLSLGSAVAAFVSYLEPQVDAVALYVPILGLNQMIAQHHQRWGDAGAEIAKVMQSDAVSALMSVVDPLAVVPGAPQDDRMIVGAWHDRMALRHPAELLHEKWKGTLHWHDGGHVGVMLSSAVTSITEDFLRRAVSA
ncbi:alpha/beta hydrolase family protein [Mycolicibacterium vinylchloridicum]|uniref:alpha/beta hydrolase n=1 Tax=Mycolicibacterium vinylchloridicum TaxID=2736928 RepID=UPI0015CAE824|nr:alpha/beta hydrolase [Mycolicibacterium vinylchloridicum]